VTTNRAIGTTTARRFGALLIGGAAAGVGLLLIRPPVEGAYPLCPWKAITGTDCPFCGGMRCVAALAHGDIAAAVDYNLLVAAAVPLLLLIGVAAVVLGPRAQPLVDRLFAPRTVLVVSCLVLAWFVLRLLPVAPGLSSAVPM
jgi:hypothetical protein